MLGRHTQHGLRLLGMLVVAALVIAVAAEVVIALRWPEVLPAGPAQFVADLITPRRTVADLLAHPPAPEQTVDVDAYLSPAGRALCGTQASNLLADRPFLAELTVLGTPQANALPYGEPWCVAVATDQAPLPYHARLRGHLEVRPAVGDCTESVRIFTIERVVRTYAAQPPAADPTPDPAVWPRYQATGAVYSVPCPPGWSAEPVDSARLLLRTPDWLGGAIEVHVYPGETHHDPYDPDALPQLLKDQSWSVFAQAAALGRQGAASGLVGYRIDRAGGPSERTAEVLLSANGRTFGLSARYPLGLAASQQILDAFAGIVAGFRLEAPLAPSPTPPVRQALGPGPLLNEDEALAASCGCLRQQITGVVAQQLMPEVEARHLGNPCAMFRGHNGGVWVLTVETPLAERTHTMRLLLDAATGRELCREEVDPNKVATSEAGAAGLPAALLNPAKSKRWIEVILSTQTVIAWEGDTAVRRMLASTGLPGTPTVTGSFHIYRKVVSTTMTGPGYSLPDVPHTLFFFEGYSLHGAYWHNNFGVPMSHGCVNLSLPDAAWLFDWAEPHLAEGEWGTDATPCNPGTLVVVHD